MSPRRRTHQPVQRRPRSERACHFCRIAKQRCESMEYGTNDGPCRRCFSQGLDCNIPRAARSQSPSSGFGVQGSGLVRHHITPHSAGGVTTELAPGSEPIVQCTPQQSESVAAPMEGWPPFVMRPDEQQGSSTSVLSLGQTPPQAQNFFPLTSSMEGYQQRIPNAAQGSGNLQFVYYDPYGHHISCNAYVAGYAVQGASGGAPNFGFAMEEPQPDDEGEFADGGDATNFSHSDES